MTESETTRGGGANVGSAPADASHHTPRAVGQRGAAADLADSLQIAGLVPLSTVDWPGKLAAALFLQGCPWRCVYCHNQAILDPRTPGTVPFSAVRDLLERRKGLLDAVVFSGGEATMQHPLVDAAREVKERGFLVGLHTGGAFPSRIRSLVQPDNGAPLVDWVGFDLKATPSLYARTVRGAARAWEAARESFSLLNTAGIDIEVRTTVTPALAGHLDEIVDTYDGLDPQGARRLVLQQARADGAPAEFASCLPVAAEWDAIFRDAAAKAIEYGRSRGIDVSVR